MARASTQRTFLRGAGTAAIGIGLAANAFGRAGKVAPSDQINVGSIGVGPMGSGHLGYLLGQKDVRMAAVCDVYEPKVGRAIKRCGGNAKGYADFRKLLDDKDVDAVVIAPPPHWHALMSIAACKAGKDFYVEKPMTLYLDESKAVVAAVRKHKRITQVGTQVHAAPNYRNVVGMIRSGVLGPVNLVRTFNVMNQTRRGIGSPANCPPPAGLDWEMWVGPAPMRPCNPAILRGAFHHCSFMDFSGGWLPGMAPHIIDLPIWALDLGLPTQVSCEGGRYVLDDAGDCPDVQEALFQYPGLTMTWMSNLTNSYGFDFHGRGGMARRLGIYFHAELATLFANYGTHKIVPEDRNREFKFPASTIPPLADHHRQWLDGIRTRKQPSCNVFYNHRVNVPCALANLSLRLRRSIAFDPDTEAIVGDPEAARLSMPAYRKPWTLG